jgi:hydroxymethylbilane synthase
LSEQLLPAIGQGAVALQAREDRPEVLEVLRTINDEPTMLAIRAEREVQRLLAGDCSVPIGVRTELRDGVLRMQGILFRADSAEPRLAEAEGTEPELVARELVAGLGTPSTSNVQRSTPNVQCASEGS